MNDTLRTQNLLPTTEPYSALTRFSHVGGELVDPAVFAVTGNNAIVDWVLVELRRAGDPTQIVATRAALVQRDGDVVDVDGVAPVVFANQNPGSYYVAVGQRNHLRVMTAAPVTVTDASPLVDFTNPNTPTYGTYAQATVGNVRALWAGDANTNNQVVYAGPNNDQNAVLTVVLTDPGNTAGNANYVVNGYGVTDLNLDGKTIAAGPNNEMNVILTTIFTHPGNSSANANYVVQEQVPAGVLMAPVIPDVFAGSANLILSDEFLAIPLSETEEKSRWQQGLPVPLTSIPDETTLPRAFTAWEGAGAATANPVAQSTTTTVNVVDGWIQRDEETLEQALPSAGGCVWRTGHLTNKAHYQWGRADTHHKGGDYAIWPAGTAQNGAPGIPNNAPYPDNVESWWQCELTQVRTLHNFATEFELWLELDNDGDSFEVRFYDVDCTSATLAHYRGGLQWKGTGQGLANTPGNWRNYRVAVPGLQSTSNNKLCLEFKFSSDQIDGNYPAAQGPWLDNVQLWDYAKPESSANCQTKDPTVTVTNAPGDGAVSKGIVVPPYTDDIRAGVVDDPNNLLDMAGMVERLKAADVQWVRLEFTIPPAELMRTGAGLGPYGVSYVDLRHYDRLIDMLCANDIAVLGLVDNQTLARQDWNDEAKTAEYITDFTLATKQLAGYFKDRIRYWEIWNEPNFSLSAIEPSAYAQLLIDSYDTIKTIESTDKVLFAGLAQATGEVAGNSNGYFIDTSAQLALRSRQNPAPYDLFALHPYPSNEYIQNGKVVVDPAVYLQWEQPTTINKFFETMEENGKQNQPIWITEMGWNGSANTMNEVTKACPAVNQTWVSREQQALYAVRGFDILFTETGWSPSIPSVTKIFWYQYVDVSIPAAECHAATSAGTTPSGPASYRTRGRVLAQAQEAPQAADWWFGLYSGINWVTDEETKEVTGYIEPNLVQCTFREYPTETPGEILHCLNMVYLPFIQSGAPAATGQ
ncbi:MAG: hypothetical protein R3C14_04480 [Caldilineaceae bacterium]